MVKTSLVNIILWVEKMLVTMTFLCHYSRSSGMRHKTCLVCVCCFGVGMIKIP